MTTLPALPTPFNILEDVYRAVTGARSSEELDRVAAQWTGERQALIFHLSRRLRDLNDALFRSVVREADYLPMDNIIHVADNLTPAQEAARTEVLLERLAAAKDLDEAQYLLNTVREVSRGVAHQIRIMETALCVLKRTTPRGTAPIPEGGLAETLIGSLISHGDGTPAALYRELIDTVAMNERTYTSLIGRGRLDNAALAELYRRDLTPRTRTILFEVIRQVRELRMSPQFRDEVLAWTQRPRPITTSGSLNNRDRTNLRAFNVSSMKPASACEVIRSWSHSLDALDLADVLELATPELVAPLSDTDWTNLMAHEHPEVRSAALRAMGRSAASKIGPDEDSSLRTVAGVATTDQQAPTRHRR